MMFALQYFTLVRITDYSKLTLEGRIFLAHVINNLATKEQSTKILTILDDK